MMGTSGSYSGSGGKAGKTLRQGLAAWIDALPPQPANAPPNDQLPDQPELPSQDEPDQRPTLPPEILASAIALMRPSSSRGSGSNGAGGAVLPRTANGGTGGRRQGGGAQRSARRAATSAGRAAAAAYAFSTGDREILARLGLDYDELRQITDPLELTRRIVEVACGPRSDSTIEDHEQRYVAAEIADWILDSHEEGLHLEPDEIVRKAIAVVMVEVVESETGDLLRRGGHSPLATEAVERELRATAEVWAERVELSPDGITEDDFARAIESGIETLRRIFGETGQ